MVRSRRMSPWPLALVGALCLACSGDPFGPVQPKAGDPSTASATATAEAEAKAGGPAATKAGAADPATAEAEAAPPKTPPKAVLDHHDDGKPLGKVLDGAPLPLTEMLGQGPAVVESHLGPPQPNSKGGTREACVRHIPERTWFRCKMAWQRYADKTGTFQVVRVVYEDGKAAGLDFEGIPGEGAFDPKEALRKVGLEVPGRAKVETPEEGVTVWSWFNSEARLLIHGRQYRVRVSTVGGKWETGKVEITLNDALNESEKARVIVPGEEPEPAPADAPAG
ncbi:MAG: hypothetical protein KDK70_06190 [Myxococcales bacterium]|nr:hypothetical protein [Myxococcales bacterium]